MIGEFIYMLPSDMNLRIGKVKNYNNKILISSPSFKIGTNVKINLDDEKDKPDVKSKEVEMVKSEPNVKQKKEPDGKSNKEHKQNVKPNIKLKHDVKIIRTKPDTNKITYEEEKVASILGTTTVFTVCLYFSSKTITLPSSFILSKPLCKIDMIVFEALIMYQLCFSSLRAICCSNFVRSFLSIDDHCSPTNPTF